MKTVRVEPEEDRTDSEAPQRLEGPNKSTVQSLSYAWEGVVHAFAAHKHTRMQAVTVFLVVLAAVGLNVPPLPFLSLLGAMMLVVVAQLLNTALEYVAELTGGQDKPVAQAARNIADGAVLVAGVFAFVTGIIVFVHFSDLPSVFAEAQLPRELRIGVLQLTALGLFIVALIVGTVKRVSKRGTLTLGGPVSGHAAIGFLLATAIIFVTGNLSAAILAVALAMLIVQSRFQTGVHSLTELLLGSALGVLVGIVLFGSVPR